MRGKLLCGEEGWEFQAKRTAGARSWDHPDLPCMIRIQGMGPGSGPSATGMVERDEVEELAFGVVS